MYTSSQRKCQCTLAYNTCVRLACLDSTDRQHNHSHALLSMQLQSKEMLYPEYPIFLNNHVLHAMKGVNRDCLLPIWLLTIEQVEQFFVWHNVSIAALKLIKLTTRHMEGYPVSILQNNSHSLWGWSGLSPPMASWRRETIWANMELQLPCS